MRFWWARRAFKSYAKKTAEFYERKIRFRIESSHGSFSCDCNSSNTSNSTATGSMESFFHKLKGIPTFWKIITAANFAQQYRSVKHFFTKLPLSWSPYAIFMVNQSKEMFRQKSRFAAQTSGPAIPDIAFMGHEMESPPLRKVALSHFSQNRVVAIHGLSSKLTSTCATQSCRT